MRIQKISESTQANIPTGIHLRSEERLAPQRGAEFVIQKDWGHLAQVSLDQRNIILAEILDISKSGVGCKVAYKFDVVNPIPIDITFAVQNNKSSIYSFEQVTIPALIVRSVDLEGIFCEIGIKFMSLNSFPEKKLNRLIDEIT